MLNPFLLPHLSLSMGNEHAWLGADEMENRTNDPGISKLLCNTGGYLMKFLAHPRLSLQRRQPHRFVGQIIPPHQGAGRRQMDA
jgi:hypothetical protein